PAGDRRRTEDGSRRGHPDRGRSQRIARRLEEDVPRDVEHRRARDQDEHQWIHVAILGCRTWTAFVAAALAAEVAPREGPSAEGDAAGGENERGDDSGRVPAAEH